ncbi:TPA: urease subunit beta [Klebsiella pneumoniae]|uniref:urease subunit beta n=1 Tax=Klebsiella pneumoniae TaxID=573 RepID=UPI000E2C24F3|nr:urease subunit beta [Klebsiella pneumoniae]SWN11360.1 urease subunit beta [Klebsiella pneumoniae]HBR4718573.1 urease subunit beta [Klebsiella pneumoniae]HBY0200351.1 urease subunit beta [Klebsiella pneumoniae]
MKKQSNTSETMVKKVETGVSVGGYVLADSPITFNEGRSITTVHVKNTGDRPIQVGSHFHFFEANKALEFERSKAFGKRLNITATTAIRFEPGDAITVELIPFIGQQVVYGFNNLVDGWVGNASGIQGDAPEDILNNAIKHGFKSVS